MARRAGLILLVVLALAGCASPPSATEPAPAPSLTVRYGECVSIEIFAPIPMEDARAAMPEGYEPASFDGNGMMGVLVTAVGSCESIRVGGVELGPGGHGFTLLGVVPPHDKAGAADVEAIVLRQVVAHEAERAALASWGHTNVVLGEAEVGLVASGARVVGALAAEGFSVESDGAFPTPPSMDEPYSVRFHDVTGVPIMDIALDGDLLAVGTGTTRPIGVGFDGSHAGIAYHRAPDPMLVEMRGVAWG